MSDLGTMVVSYAADLSGWTSKIGQVKSDLASTSDSAQSSGSGIFGGFGKAISGAVSFGAQLGQTVFGIKTLADSAIGLGQALLDPAESAETMQTAFTTLLGSTSAANNELAKLDTFASHTPFQTMDIDRAASQLIGFGTSAQHLVPDLTAIGDSLSAVGRGSAANLDSVVNVFGKIQTQGKLSVGIMQELSDNGINAWAVLGQQTGKTRDQLQTMIQQGLFPANVAIQDLTTGIEKNPLYAGGMAKQSNTMVGLVSTLKSNWDQLLASFGSPIIKELEGGLANVGTALSSPAFKSFASGIGQDIANVFSDIGSVIKPVGDGFKEVGDTLGTWLLPELQGVAKTVQGVLGDAFSHGGSNLKIFSSTLSPLKLIFDGISDGIKTFSKLLMGTNIAGPLSTGLTQLKSLGNDLLPPLERLGEVVIKTVIPAVEHLVTGRLSAMFQIFQAFKPVFDEILPPLVKFGGFLIDGLGKGIQFLMPYFLQATDAINKFGVEIAQRVAPIAKQWIGELLKDGKAFSIWWGQNWPWIGLVLKGVWDTIVGGVKIAWSLLSGIIKIGLDILSGNWKQVWTDVKDMLSGIWDGMKQQIQGSLGVILGILYGIGKNIADALKAPFENALGFIGGVFNTIQGWWNTLSGHSAASLPAPGGGVAGHASGILNSPVGHFAMVGEKGPELMYIPKGGSIFPNGQYPIKPSAGMVAASVASSGGSSAGAGNGGSHTTVVELDGMQLAHVVQKYSDEYVRLKIGAGHRSRAA